MRQAEEARRESKREKDEKRMEQLREKELEKEKEFQIKEQLRLEEEARRLREYNTWKDPYSIDQYPIHQEDNMTSFLNYILNHKVLFHHYDVCCLFIVFIYLFYINFFNLI